MFFFIDRVPPLPSVFLSSIPLHSPTHRFPFSTFLSLPLPSSLFLSPPLSFSLSPYSLQRRHLPFLHRFLLQQMASFLCIKKFVMFCFNFFFCFKFFFCFSIWISSSSFLAFRLALSSCMSRAYSFFYSDKLGVQIPWSILHKITCILV